MRFAQYLLLRESFDTPEAQKAVSWLYNRFHGADEATLKELKDPNLPYILIRKFGVDSHEVGDIIRFVADQFRL